MSSYQKFTLKTFKGKLENGDYENATGANRAIGKTQELSEGDKARAKAMVAVHFGVEPAKAKTAKKKASKPSKKAAKTKVAKAPAKKSRVKPAKAALKPARAPKTAKKAAKRGKKKASTRKAAAAAPAADPAPAVAEPAPARAKPIRAAVAAAPAAVGTSRESKIQLMGQIINHVDVILRSMELSKKLYPKGDVEQGVKSAQTIMSRAVSELEKAVTFDDGTAAPTPAATPAAKVSTKKGKRATKALTAVVEDEEVPDGEVAGGALDLDDPSLTEDEREEIRLARSVRPAVDRRFGSATA